MKLWNLILTVVLGSKCPDQCQCYAGPNEPMCVMLGLTEFPDISQSPDIENFILLGNNITTLPQLANQERILLVSLLTLIPWKMSVSLIHVKATPTKAAKLIKESIDVDSPRFTTRFNRSGLVRREQDWDHFSSCLLKPVKSETYQPSKCKYLARHCFINSVRQLSQVLFLSLDYFFLREIAGWYRLSFFLSVALKTRATLK